MLPRSGRFSCLAVVLTLTSVLVGCSDSRALPDPGRSSPPTAGSGSATGMPGTVAPSSAGPGAGPSGGPPSAAPGGGTGDTSAGPPVAVDWKNPAKAPLPGGWGLADCPGDAPLVCVTNGGRTVGQLELLSFPLASIPTLQETLGKRGEAAALDEHARGYLKDFTADRAGGCGASYRVTPDGPRALTVKGRAAVRYGFVGTLGDGRPSEKIIQYAQVRGADLVLLSATASDPGGCLPAEGPHFTTPQLTALAPTLDRVVVGSGFPVLG